MSGKNGVVGWVLFWRVEGEKNFDCSCSFFEEMKDGSKCKYSYDPFGNGEEALYEVQASERANHELKLLLDGKIKKYGKKVVDGCVVPVMREVKARTVKEIVSETDWECVGS